MKKVVVAVVNHSMSNAFSILEIMPKYNIDLLDLDDRFRRALSFVHPDLFIQRTAQERTMAANIAVKLTEAYQILKDPLKRAAELLRINGVDVPGENGKTVSHPTLLAQIMQWREELDSCKVEKQVDILEQELRQRLDLIKASFDRDKPDSLAYLYLELVYITKILEEIRYHPLRKVYVRSTH